MSTHVRSSMYATSHYLLLFPAKNGIMHMYKAFVNMLLTEEDVVSDCHCNWQHLNGPRITMIIRRCWTRRWFQRRNVYAAQRALSENLRNEDPKCLKKKPFLELQVN